MYYDPSGYTGNQTLSALCGNTGDGEKPKDTEVKRVGEDSIATNPFIQINGNSYDIDKLQKTQPYTYPENVS